MTVIEAVRLGDVLRRARIDAGLNQGQLAEKCGVSQGQVSKWERGKAEPTVSELRAVASSTGADWLYNLRELPSRCTPTGAGRAA